LEKRKYRLRNTEKIKEPAIRPPMPARRKMRGREKKTTIDSLKGRRGPGEGFEGISKKVKKARRGDWSEGQKNDLPPTKEKQTHWTAAARSG